MMLLGKKVGMTQVYDSDGNLLGVTVIQAGPCSVMQVKTAQTDGYNAVQLGFEDVKTSRRKKPQIGHSQKADTAPKKFVREMRLTDDSQQEYKLGDSITVSRCYRHQQGKRLCRRDEATRVRWFSRLARHEAKTQSTRVDIKFCQQRRPRRKAQKRQKNGRTYGQPQGNNKKPSTGDDRRGEKFVGCQRFRTGAGRWLRYSTKLNKPPE